VGDNEGEEEEEGWSRRVGVEKRGCEIGELREHAAAPKDDLFQILLASLFCFAPYLW
jgi:hypothetical protein